MDLGKKWNCFKNNCWKSKQRYFAKNTVTSIIELMIE